MLEDGCWNEAINVQGEWIAVGGNRDINRNSFAVPQDKDESNNYFTFDVSVSEFVDTQRL